MYQKVFDNCVLLVDCFFVTAIIHFVHDCQHLIIFVVIMVMPRLHGWMRDDRLSLAFSKTKIIVLNKNHIQTIIPMRTGDLEVDTKPRAKYHGIIIDSKISCVKQIWRTTDKTARGVTFIASLITLVPAGVDYLWTVRRKERCPRSAVSA